MPRAGPASGRRLHLRSPTGKAPVVRRWPMIPGIDFAGTVESSTHPEFKPGDDVILNGWGVGETHFGAYAERARVKGDWLVPLPETMSAVDAMAVGKTKAPVEQLTISIDDTPAGGTLRIEWGGTSATAPFTVG